MRTLAQWREQLAEEPPYGPDGRATRYYRAEMVDLLETGEREAQEARDEARRLEAQIEDLLDRAAIDAENELRRRLGLALKPWPPRRAAVPPCDPRAPARVGEVWGPPFDRAGL